MGRRVSIDGCLTLPDKTTATLKAFREADLDAIIALERRASTTPWTEHNFLTSLRSGHLCVGAQQGSRWLAQAVFSQVMEEAELLIIAVDTPCQGQGIASQLLHTMEWWLGQSSQRLFLEVRASNIGAIRFYEKQGFDRLGCRRNYYPVHYLSRRHSHSAAFSDREDALVYGKYLNNHLTI